MKSAALTILLGVFLCGVVSNPVANDGTPQTAEAESYPGPGRSRDNDYDGRGRRGDGDYGYNRRGDDGYKHHDSFFPDYPARPPVCACQRDLDWTPLSDKNRCGDVAGCNTPSGYCTGSTTPAITITQCACANAATFGNEATFGSCIGNYDSAATPGGALCLQATCPSDGSIRIKGQAVPAGGAVCNGGCTAAVDFLYVYRGTLATGTPLFATSQQVVDTTVPCTKNEVFQVCEKNGVILTNSVRFTFTGQTTGTCNRLGAGTNWVSLGCTP